MKPAIKQYLSQLGQKGGTKTKELHGREHFIEMQKKSVRSRRLRATRKLEVKSVGEEIRYR